MNSRYVKSVEHKYLPEFVYGSMDGTITTFAVVSVVMGASLSSSIILILGFANLVADGFSMSLSNYLSTSSSNDLNKRIKGFKRKSALKTSIATFVSFFVVGFIPLFPFVLATVTNNFNIEANQFIYSIFFTALALGIVGWFKGKITKKNRITSSIQTITIGGIAASLAFLIGLLIKNLIG